ncbi:Golgi nucleotide sugar transporter 2 isoform 2 [Theobroma cacao]|uniref:Golgi nucleotide sugar transporter 2 isoform 2 n=1 Tax=Theobroma cacao TaxID=3641 RepID=A0A061GZX0_THECC|nr:Golgi nucleotide sugar transporter 2 isoform 2 [Theobroma cacao]
MSNIKLDQVVCHDSEESELTSWNGKVTSDKNRAYEILNSIHQQGQRSINSITANAEPGTLTERFLKGNRAAIGDSFNLPFDGNEKRAHVFGRRSGPLLSGTAYCISSCSMILLNKVVLSSYNFSAGISLMFYQNLISCLVVAILGLCRAVSVEKLTWKLIRIISAVSGSITDLSFDATGYTWQILNCILTAGYSLTLRRVMDKAKQTTKSGSLNEVSMVLLNNLLSLPFAIFLIIVLDEWEYVINVDIVKLPMFWVVATASGLLGLAISFTSMWFLHQTGPTTYSLVGSLNKIPISIAGIVLFKVPLSIPNTFSILFGLFAGIFFARAKMS